MMIFIVFMPFIATSMLALIFWFGCAIFLMIQKAPWAVTNLRNRSLAVLIRQYFSENWPWESEEGTLDGALDAFIRFEGVDAVSAAAHELGKLLANINTEHEASALLTTFGSAYRPVERGESSLGWLNYVQNRLQQATMAAA